MKTKEEWFEWVESITVCRTHISDKLYELEQRAENAESAVTVMQDLRAKELDRIEGLLNRMRAHERVAVAAALFFDNHLLNDNGGCNLSDRDRLSDALDELDRLEKLK